MCVCVYTQVCVSNKTMNVCERESVRAGCTDLWCIPAHIVCVHFAAACVRECVCIEGSVNSHGSIGAVFSVLLSVATAKWLDKNQKDLSHSSICIQEEKGWMLSSVGWGHALRWREQEKGG